MRAAVFLLAIAFISSKSMRSDISTKFKDSKIYFEIVEEKSAKFKRYKTVPDSIIPGDSTEIKLQYELLEEVDIKDVYIETFIGGISLFTNTVEVNKHYSLGDIDAFNFVYTFPTYCPPGHWDIDIILRKKDDTKAAVLRAYFDLI